MYVTYPFHSQFDSRSDDLRMTVQIKTEATAARVDLQAALDGKKPKYVCALFPRQSKDIFC